MPSTMGSCAASRCWKCGEVLDKTCKAAGPHPLEGAVPPYLSSWTLTNCRNFNTSSGVPTTCSHAQVIDYDLHQAAGMHLLEVAVLVIVVVGKLPGLILKLRCVRGPLPLALVRVGLPLPPDQHLSQGIQ